MDTARILRTAGEMLKVEMAKRGMEVEVQIEPENKEPSMAKRETVTIPTVDEAQLTVKRNNAIEDDLQKCDAEIDRYRKGLKAAKEAKEKLIMELRGNARRLPLLDGEGPNDE